MAWTVLCCPMVVSTGAPVGGNNVPVVLTFGAPFDENGNAVSDSNGNAIQITGTAALQSTYRQPSDYWDALESSMESQLSQLDGYVTGTVYYRIDLPTS